MTNTFFFISNLRVALFNWDALNLAIMIITIFLTARRLNTVIRPVECSNFRRHQFAITKP
jgi:hypothetical protein